MTRSPPVILLTATLRWPIAARLAMAFTDLGCRVEVLCPVGHPAVHVRAVSALHRHGAAGAQRSLRAAIAACAPDLVVPCDDDAAVQLQRLHAGATGDVVLRGLLERSLGVPAACTLATRRDALLARAVDAGVRTAPSAPLDGVASLHRWIGLHGLPVVIKADGSWGGRGVALAFGVDEAVERFERMAAPPSPLRGLARLLLDRDLAPLLQALRPQPAVLSVQRHIDGRPANRAVACWRGEVLAGLSVEALQTRQPTGPATVVRPIDHGEMAQAAERLVRSLGVSGFWGLDFVIETTTGAAHLIEVNPRATPSCHLAPGVVRSLPAALLAQLGGAPAPVPVSMLDARDIALFPGEWRRDPASAALVDAHHDVPWREPALVHDGTAPPWAERGVVARAWRALRRARPVTTLAPVAGLSLGPAD